MDSITFITYSKRKLKYELIDLLGGLGFLSIFILAIGQKTNSQFIERNSPIFVGLFIFGFIWIILRLFIGRMKSFKPVQRTGEIEFIDAFIVTKDRKFDLNEIKRIRIIAMFCKGQPSGRSGLSDGAGNSIEITLKDNSKHKTKFVIDDNLKREKLKIFLDEWKQKGIMIIGEWKPF